MTRALIPPDSGISSPALYDRDFLLWIEATINNLRVTHRSSETYATGIG